jgi:hypothetical protein
MKHKHADLIHAWADGAKIETRYQNAFGWTEWKEEVGGFIWYNGGAEYRIKPEPKPDAVIYAYIPYPSSDEPHTFKLFSGIGHSIVHNVKFTWDGETEKLKSAEVIK